MKLRKIIKQARSTTLKQLSSKDITDEVVVDYLNLTLLDLYSRFQLDTEEMIIRLKAGKSTYSLDGTDTDVENPSGKELLQIVSAWDVKGEIGINNDIDLRGIFTVTYDKIQVPALLEGAILSLVYKPAPDEVVYVDSGDGSAADANIRLPMALTDAVLKGLAYYAHDSAEGTSEGKSAAYYAKYEAACKTAENRGVVPSDAIARDVKIGGFV